METISYELLQVYNSLIPRKGIYTFHMRENVVRINCDNECFIECVSLNTNGRSASTKQSSKECSTATDYSSIKRIYCITSPNSKTTITNYVAKNIFSYGKLHLHEAQCPNKMTIEFPINKIEEEELVPPCLDSKIPFVSVNREQLRKAFEFAISANDAKLRQICNHRVMLYLLSDTFCIQCNGMKISLPLIQSIKYEGAYLEFEHSIVEQIVRFLGSLHHTHVKLHIHKDFIFRIVAQSSSISAFKSDMSITLYCGHS